MGAILVTGGLGFIGSHTVVELLQNAYEVVIVDNLSNSKPFVLDRIEEISGKRPVFYEADINDADAMDTVFSEQQIDAVIHFAAFKAVGESVQFPLKYYRNNVGGLINLLEVMEQHRVSQMVFSSSCTVYGEPDYSPVDEAAPVKQANSPYGYTKQVCEAILHDSKQFKSIALRYFNPIGAHESALIGELPIGVPANLVPYITQSAAGLRSAITVHGSDYATPDGTCIRDYLHVSDLADAHVKAVARLLKGSGSEHFEVFNLGTGKGSSVLEVLQSFERVNDLKVSYTIGPRRAGDVEKVWADVTRANTVLGWKTKRDLDEMLRSAWKWQLSLKD